MKNAFTDNYIKTVINDDHDVGNVQDARIAPKYLRKTVYMACFYVSRNIFLYMRCKYYFTT